MNSAGQFEAYRGLLFSIAYRMLGSAMEAEDLVQEAFHWTGKAKGVYILANPIEPELLNLRSNRVEKYPRRTANDGDVRSVREEPQAGSLDAAPKFRAVLRDVVVAFDEPDAVASF